MKTAAVHTRARTIADNVEVCSVSAGYVGFEPAIALHAVMHFVAYVRFNNRQPKQRSPGERCALYFFLWHFGDFTWRLNVRFPGASPATAIAP